jgi:hypothetical protein
MVWARKSRAALCPLLILVIYPLPLHSIAGALRSTPSLPPPHGPVFPPLRERPRGGNDGDGSPPGDDGSTIRRESRMAGGGLHTAPASVIDDQPTSPHPVCLPGLRASGDHAVGSHPLNPLMAFNSLTKSKVPILPFEDGKILMYSWVCPFLSFLSLLRFSPLPITHTNTHALTLERTCEPAHKCHDNVPFSRPSIH